MLPVILLLAVTGLSVAIVAGIVYEYRLLYRVGVRDCSLVRIGKDIQILDNHAKNEQSLSRLLLRNIFGNINFSHGYDRSDGKHLIDRMPVVNNIPKLSKVVGEFPLFDWKMIAVQAMSSDVGWTIAEIADRELIGGAANFNLGKLGINMGTLGVFQGIGVTYRGFSISCGSPSGSYSNWQSPTHVIRLLLHRAELKDGDHGLQQSHDSQNSSENNQPPIGRRFITYVSAACCALATGWWGVGQIFRGRRLCGFLAIGASLFLFAATGVLFFLTGFSWSWGWWW